MAVMFDKDAPEEMVPARLLGEAIAERDAARTKLNESDSVLSLLSAVLSDAPRQGYADLPSLAAALKADRDHWKANHTTEVTRSRLLKERPDMPIERVQAYERHLELAAQVNAPRGTSAQIQNERSITADSIEGAMLFGYQGINEPPSDDHWLAPWWKKGREMAEKGPSAETLRAAVERFDTVMASLEGCTDGGCVIRPPKGMHTNGGCQCVRKATKMYRLAYCCKELRDAVADASKTGA